MRRPLLLVPPVLAAFLSASAHANLPVPVVHVHCEGARSVVTVATVANTFYEFHFRRLFPPLERDVNLTARSTVATISNFVPGSWTLVYTIADKDSPSQSFRIPDCGRSTRPVPEWRR
jgi:hypothetical protein